MALGTLFTQRRFTKTYNFKTMTNMRLLASTSGAVLPIDPLNIKMVPLNNQMQWTPCITVMVLNGEDYGAPKD